MDKILKIQSEIGVLSKDKENPFYKSSYFDINSLIAQLLPLLEKHGLTVMQPLTSVSAYIGRETTIPTAQPALETMIYDGDKLIHKSSVPLPTTIFEKNKEKEGIERPMNSQEYGSAITYFRRYALQSLFLLQAEDDDGNKAKGRKLEDNEDPF